MIAFSLSLNEVKVKIGNKQKIIDIIMNKIQNVYWLLQKKSLFIDFQNSFVLFLVWFWTFFSFAWLFQKPGMDGSLFYIEIGAEHTKFGF